MPKKTIKKKSTVFSLQYLIDVAEGNIQSKNYNMERLQNILPAMHKLNNVIGMTNAKQNVAEIINLYTIGVCNTNNDMMHTMIQGGSGTGKTMLARILGEIYWKMGILDGDKEETRNVINGDEGQGTHRQLRKKQKIDYEKQLEEYDYDDGFLERDYSESEDESEDEEDNTGKYKFIEASRTDCIDRYQGGTADKTAKLVKSAIGGVLFIDEAYSLGNTGAEDTYNKECIDTLTSLMEKYKGKVVIILAGYTHSMEDTLLHYNQGLSRRIPFNVIVADYSPKDLSDILKHMIDNIDVNDPWLLEVNPKSTIEFFTTHYHAFPHFGGDIETLVFHTKIMHSRRLAISSCKRKVITMEDIDAGFERYNLNRLH